MNWQWVAGTGTDTRRTGCSTRCVRPTGSTPRAFYVRRYLPELAEVDGAAVHRPWDLPAHQRRRLDYPDPIVDLRDAAERFRRARS